MPKMSRDFPEQLSLGVTLDMKQKLQAMGYLLGAGGQYAASVRNLLQVAINQFISGLDDRRRVEYDSILTNIKAREVLK